MIYADYDYYKNSFGGKTIPEEDFSRAALSASQYIDAATFGRAAAAADTDAVKNACCALAECCYSGSGQGSSYGYAIAAEKVGDHSVTYTRAGEDGAKVFRSQLENTAKQWLGGTGLMYRGYSYDDKHRMHDTAR